MFMNGRDDSGFALVEVLAVMVIMGMLAVVGTTQASNWRTKAHLTAVRADAKQTGDSLLREIAEHVVDRDVTQSGRAVMLGSEPVTTITKGSKVTGFDTYNNEVAISVYRGEDPEHADMYASYSSVDGGLCKSGLGPVQPCDPLDGSEPPTGDTDEEGSDVGAGDETDNPDAPPATSPNGVGSGDETDPDEQGGGSNDTPVGEITPKEEPVALITNPNDYSRAPIPTGLACTNGSQIVSQANNTGATSVNLEMKWNPVAGASKYDVHLTPVTPGGSMQSFKTTTKTNTITFNMPRPKVKWGQPIAGEDTSFYGNYSFRVLPHVDGKSGDPQYLNLQYNHNNIGCWGNITFDQQRPPVTMFNPYSIAYTIDKHDSKTSNGYADVHFTWDGVNDATKYRVSVFSSDKNNKYGADTYVTGTELDVRFPRKQLDQYSNPVGGQDADFYTTYWVRIQPIGSTWDGDARYRMFRYYHHDQGLHAPDGYY